ncbi:MAG: PAS domain-containing protein, partial [Burkholderiales bacterium]
MEDPGRLTQAKLRDEAAQLRLIVDNVPAMLIAYDKHLHCLFANRRFAEFFGLTTASIVGKHPREIIGEGPYHEVKSHFDRVLDGHRAAYKRTRVFDDGRLCYLEVELIPHLAQDGSTLGLFAVTTDVTEHVRAAQALHDSAEKLRLFADNVPAMTVSYDEALRCRFANRRYADFFGFTVDSILGRHLREVVGEAVYRQIEAHFTHVLRGYPVTYTRTHKLANGETRHLEIKVQPHIGEQGKVLGCFTVTADITEQKLTEERIRRMAHHDSLTELPNRLLFNDRLEQAIS